MRTQLNAAASMTPPACTAGIGLRRCGLLASSWLATAMTFLGVGDASAADGGAPVRTTCDGPDLVVVGSPRARWKQTVTEVAARVRRDRDVDSCARLTLSSVADTVVLDVALADGRHARRTVLEPNELLETTQALITLPPPRRGPLRSMSSADESTGRTGDSPPRVAAPVPRAQFELGVAGTARLAGKPYYAAAGAGGYGQLALNGWLMAIAGRWDVSDVLISNATPARFNMQTIALGIGVGRRFELGAWRLDIVADPEIVVESQEAEGSADGLEATGNDVRVDLLARISGPREHTLRIYGTADFEASPSRLRRPKQLDDALPGLPAWSSGLALGVAWGPP
jgi:hypothetical protein